MPVVVSVLIYYLLHHHNTGYKMARDIAGLSDGYVDQWYCCLAPHGACSDIANPTMIQY